MDRQYIDAHQIVDRYVMNKLSDDERSEFEAVFLDDPGLQDEIEMARAMHAELRLSQTRLQNGSRRTKGLLTILASPAFGGAAAGICIVSLLFSAIMYARLDSHERGGTPEIVGVTEIWIEQTRSGGQTLETSLTAGPLLLHIDVGPQPADTYQVRITPATGEPGAPVTVTRDTEFSITVLLRNPQPGRYTLTVDALIDGQAVQVGEHSLHLKQTQ